MGNQIDRYRMRLYRFWIIWGWAIMLLTLYALGQGGAPDDYPDEFVDDGFGGVFNVIFLVMFFAFIAACCVLIGIGIVLGLAILAGLAAMLGAGGVVFGAGGVVASLAGGIVSRKPKVGWRIFSMWMHAGFMMLVGACIGGFVFPYLYADHFSFWAASFIGLITGVSLETSILGAGVGFVTGLIWGWLLALGTEKCGGFLKQTVQPLLTRRP